MKFDNGKLKIWDAQSERFIEERVFGGGMVKFLYQNPLGRALAPAITHNKLISRAYGWAQSQSWSSKKIPTFVRDFEIKIEDFEGSPYSSFNDFFIRKFRPGLRSFAPPPAFSAPCEARYSLFAKSSADLRLGVKGAFLNPESILGSHELAQKFSGGPVAVARLCPVDYHRFHFNDSGEILESRRITGQLESVNPLSLLQLANVFSENERHLTRIRSQHFGEIAYVDVGAVCVGKMIQNKGVGDKFLLGEERGYFLFGGSTVIIFGEPGAWQWKPEFLEKCAEGWELWAPLGMALGYCEPGSVGNIGQ